MVRDKRAHAPFAKVSAVPPSRGKAKLIMSGRYSCVGKTLALTQLRFVTALLVRKYVIKLPLGEDGSRVERDMRDQFTATPGDFDLQFMIR
jgi:cytochrome P450